MMKLRILPLIFSFLLTILGHSLFGQYEVYMDEIGPKEKCRASQVHNRLMDTDPEYRKLSHKYNEQIRTIIEEKKSQPYKAGTVHTIPVVVHVVHEGEPVGTGTNISDEQVESMIVGLNRDFANTAPGNPRDGNPNGVDMEIQFCLAVRDPNDNPTNGIVRVDGSSVTDYNAKGIVDGAGGNEQAVKALSKWDNKKYLNVWSVSEINDQGSDNLGSYTGGTIGYAYFPGASANVDGVVIIYCAVGIDPDGSNGYNLWAGSNNCDAMTHEVGHYLRLSHTFQGQSCSEGDCNTEGDQVCDTPPTTQTGSCNQPNCAGRMVDNWMDYTGSGCTNRFSQGQKDRARAALEGPRGAILNSEGCIPVFDKDITITTVVSPKNFYCDSVITPEIKVKNLGSEIITSFDVVYDIDGAGAQTFAWTGSMNQNDVVNVTLPNIGTTTAPHVFNARVENPNGGADENMSNDANSGSFEIIDGEVITVRIVDYETDYNNQDSWRILDKSGTEIAGGTLDDGVGTFTSSPVCLKKECYDMELTDARHIPNGYTDPNTGNPSKEPTYEVLNEGGLNIISGFQNAPTTVFQIKPYTELQEFCLPYDPAVPIADFTSDIQIAFVNENVNFEDRTEKSNPSGADATKWDWSFGDGGTSTNQNPGHIYTTPGLYKVTLIAENNITADTAEKVGFIRVVPEPTDCFSYNNVLGSESSTTSTIVGGRSYPAANDTFRIAELFRAPDGGGKLISLMFPVGNFAEGVDLKVYKSVGNLPSGGAIYTQALTSADINPNSVNTITLTNPIDVIDKFFIAFESTGGSIELKGVQRTEPDYSNTTVVNTGSGWLRTDSVFTGVSTPSMDLEPSISPIPVAVSEPSALKICKGGKITFDSQNSEYANSRAWTFNGGIPGSSIATTATSTFNTAGVFDIQLIVTGGCNLKDTLIQQVEVNDQFTFNPDVADASCGGSNGEIVLNITGGSGSFTASWDVTPVVSGTVLSGVPAGFYKASVTDISCGSRDTTIEVKDISTLPTPDALAENTSCGIDNGKLTALPKGSEPVDFEWFDGGGTLVGTTKVLNNMPPGTYQLVVSSAACDPAQTTVNIQASQETNMLAEVSAEIFCDGDTLFATATQGNPSENYDLDWSFNNITIDTTDEFNRVFSQTGSLVFTATREDGCAYDTSFFVRVSPSPIAVASIYDKGTGNSLDTVDILTGDTVYFNSAGSVGQSFLWEYGTGESTGKKNPDYIYGDTGVYLVRFTASIGNCTEEDSMLIRVSARPTGIFAIESGVVGVFPNPVSDVLSVQLSNGVELKQIHLVDLSGREIQVNHNNNQVNTQGLSDGIYIVKIETNLGLAYHKIRVRH